MTPHSMYSSLSSSSSPTRPSKQSLHPSCTVFPDSIPIQSLPPPPPLAPSCISPHLNTTPTSTSLSPSSLSFDQYDYFQWASSCLETTQSHDLSSTAPVGAAQDDPRLTVNDAAVGAWYAFQNGIQTSTGLKQFADQSEYIQQINHPPQRRPRNFVQHRHANPSCGHPCSQCSLCHSTRPVIDSQLKTPNSCTPTSSSTTVLETPSKTSLTSSYFKKRHRGPKYNLYDFDKFPLHHKINLANECDHLIEEDYGEDDFIDDDDDDDDDDYHQNHFRDHRPHKQHEVSCNHESWSGPLITCVVDSLPKSSSIILNSNNHISSSNNTNTNGNTNNQTNNTQTNNTDGTNVQLNPNTTTSTEILSDSLTEITAEQVESGMDIQGIPWETLPFSRADYRDTRLTDQSRPRDVSDYTPDGPNYHLREPRRGAKHYDFFSNAKAVKCSIVHFQLRNLAWATSKHDVYVMHEASVVHWNAASRNKTQVLDLSGSNLANLNGLAAVQISTMIAKDDLVIAGGFYGEMVAKNMSNGCIIHNKRITYDDNAITNAIDIFDNTIMTSNNDKYVRCFDINTFDNKSSFLFETPVNHATRQPGGKMVVVAGDEQVVQVIDGDSGENVSHLHGHTHYSFATGWHPNGNMFATGSQDRTCRIWDIRNMSQQVSVLGAHMGAVRSLRFSSCGQFMMMAEPRDYVHIFDVNRGLFDSCQEIDLFGEIAGIAVTPESEGLFVAVSDRCYSGLLEYKRSSQNTASEDPAPKS